MGIWKKVGNKPLNKELCLQFDNQIGETTGMPDMIDSARMVIAKANGKKWVRREVFDCKGFLYILDQINVANGYKLLGINFLNSYVLTIADKKTPLSKIRYTFDQDPLYNNLNVTDSIIGAWQFYFLTFLDTLLPLSWHGEYDKREFIFTTEDIKLIKISENHDSVRKKLLKCDVSPKIVHMNGKYYISVCFWNNWGGLIRELCEIEIVDNKAKLEIIAFKYLCKYDCGSII